MSTAKSATPAKNGKVFDVSSPGFRYTLIVGGLTVLTVSGIHFPTPSEQLAGEIVNTLSTSGIYALIGVVVSSVIFPIWNAVKGGVKFSLKVIFSSTLTWIALGNIVLSLLALTGFMLPEGTLEAIIAAAQAKDWIALANMFFLTILPTVIRFIKSKVGNPA